MATSTAIRNVLNSEQSRSRRRLRRPRLGRARSRRPECSGRQTGTTYRPGASGAHVPRRHRPCLHSRRRSLDPARAPRYQGADSEWDDRRRRRRLRPRSVAPPVRRPHGGVADRIDHRGRSRVADPRRRVRAGRRALQAMAPRRVPDLRARDRVGRLQDDDAPDPPAPSERGQAREPSRERELPVRSHRRLDRRLRRSCAASDLPDRESVGPRRDLGRRRSDPYLRRAVEDVSRHAPSARRRSAEPRWDSRRSWSSLLVCRRRPVTQSPRGGTAHGTPPGTAA